MAITILNTTAELNSFPISQSIKLSSTELLEEAVFADNIILLNRFSHENLDSCKDPITGERISPQERDDWWRRLIGSEQYDILIEKARRSKELAYGTAGSEDHP